MAGNNGAVKLDKGGRGPTYLVCIDSSEQARFAFWTALMMSTPRDFLVLAHVGKVDASQAEREADAKLLTEYGEILREQAKGLHYKAVIRRCNHVGAELCRVARDYKANFVLIGNQGAGASVLDKILPPTGHYVVDMVEAAAKATVAVVERAGLLGSVARFVSENSRTNVILIRDRCSALQSDHVDKKYVLSEEKLERERRVADMSDGEQEKHQWIAEAMGAGIEEEEERARRIAEDSIISERKHHVEGVTA
jgi:nucleotide-binding universal stress UspA family protein